jgi:RNA polymerase sigma-70 factor (ECF subfamily)
VSEPALQPSPARDPPLTDDVLMAMASAGERAPFEALVRRYQARILRSAQRYVGDHALAHEVAQRTFIELYRYVGRYEGQGKFTRLLWRILINQCRLAWRQRDADARARTVLAALPLAPVVTPAAQLLAAEDNARLQRALGKLSDKLRAAIVLRFANELSYDDVAAVLELPLGTVKSRVAAGVAKLRELMEQDAP